MGGLGVPTGAALFVPSDSVEAARQLLSSIDFPVTDESSSDAIEDEKPWKEIPLETISGGLARIRRRRRFMWAWFLTYLPAAALETIPAAAA